MNDLLSKFKCEKQEDQTYIASADLRFGIMPKQHVYAIGTSPAHATYLMLKSAADTIQEYFYR